MKRPLRTLLVLPAIFSLVACESGAPPPPGPGVSAELADRRSRILSDLAYAWDLRIPSALEEPITGGVTIDLTWTDPDREPVVLDFREPGTRVQGVRVNDAPAEWSAVHDHLVIAAEAFEPMSTNRIEVDFTAGDDALNRSEEFLFTLFVPDRAHASLPLFDQPDLKARVSWRIETPRGWRAVANGPEIEAPDDPGEGGVWRFASSRPISTYLIAFAAGRFEVEEGEREGRRFRVFHRETDSARVARNIGAVFDLHAGALGWLEEYTEIPYPFEKYDIVLIPSFQYGGMEHPGSVFYRQSSLLLDESATQSNYLSRASLIAHETAHMWFGDLVTMEWFDDVWMKEVFANFMAARIVGPAFPEVDHDLRFLLAHHPAAYGVDRTPGANPVRQPLENLDEAGTLYGPIIYQKAPIVMAHLERTLGAETFREGLRRYLRGHAFGNATWLDLVTELDALHPEDLPAWSRVWVEEPGRPTIRVIFEPGPEGEGRLLLEQEDAWGVARRWPQRLVVHAEWEGRSEATTVEFAGGESVAVAWEGVARPDRVIPNASGIEYGLFLLDEAWVRALAEGLSTTGSDLLRGASILLLRDALLEEQIEPEILLDGVLVALETEENELVANALVGLVGEIVWRYLTPERREALAPRVEATLWNRIDAVPSRTLKATLFGAWRRVVLTPDGVRRLRSIWAGEVEVPGVPLSPDDRTGLATSLALRGVTDAEAILDQQRERIENPDRRARFDFIRPSLSADPAVREAFFTSLLDPDNRGREPWVTAGLGELHHPLRHPESARFVGIALREIEEIQRTGDIFFPSAWLSATLGSYNLPEVWEEVDAFLRARPDLAPRLRAKVEQEADALRRAVRITHGPEAAPGWRIR
ncbi:MAG: M1 family aminopeptidase [Longimicrobiales bacterium]|nr:M1 family aminopeptidase [Longimicrobiales bacterium]